MRVKGSLITKISTVLICLFLARTPSLSIGSNEIFIKKFFSSFLCPKGGRKKLDFLGDSSPSGGESTLGTMTHKKSWDLLRYYATCFVGLFL